MAKGQFQTQNDVALAISAGLVDGVKHFGQFGYKTDLSANIEALIWPGPTDEYVFPSDVGETMFIVSDNAADNQTILVQALSEDWDEVDIPVALSGTTPVEIPVKAARVNRVINISTTETQGDVSVTNAGGGVTFAVMLASEGISTQVLFSVPRGFNAKLEDTFVTLNRSGNQDTSVIFRYRRRPFGGVFGTGARFGLSKRGTSATNLPVKNVTPITAKSDIMLLAEADNGSTDVSARAPFTLYKV